MIRYLLLFCLLMSGASLLAQTSGTIVSSEDGLGLPGVSVLIKGTTTGTTTNIDGKFTLNASAGDSLKFSFVEFKTTVRIVGAEPINLTLELDSKQLEDVIVTALGVSKEKKSLGYAVTEISTKQIATVKEANVVNGVD